MYKLFISLGCLNAFLSIGLGAFAAHILENKLTPEMLSVFETGAQYHFYHALGLLIVGIIALHLTDSSWLRTAGWLMQAGIILFSGSLYILSLSGVRWFGAITPLGGICFLASWVVLAIAVLK